MSDLKVYTYIRSVLKKHKVLRREDIWKHVAKDFNHFEGDIGRRLREMPDIFCERSKVHIIIHGKKCKPWLYRLVQKAKRAA